MGEINLNKALLYASRNLQFFGIALVLTGVFVFAWKPSKIILFLTPYSGDLNILCWSLIVVGGLASILGYALKRLR
jgi:hypothetical protein